MRRDGDIGIVFEFDATFAEITAHKTFVARTGAQLSHGGFLQFDEACNSFGWREPGVELALECLTNLQICIFG